MKIVNLFIKHISYDSSIILVCSSCINFHSFLFNFHSSWIFKVLLDKAFGRRVLLKFQWLKSSKYINKSILRHYFSHLLKTLQNKICSLVHVFNLFICYNSIWNLFTYFMFSFIFLFLSSVGINYIFLWNFAPMQ
jgi:hypothetical protein